MKGIIDTLLNIYKIEELRNRIILTLGLLLVYRLGAQVVLPGIDSIQLSELSNRTITKIKLLNTEERIEEIAKMLSGKKVTESSIINAKELLSQ